jgi:cytochrome c oxidase cbb3-type subunit II
MNKQAFIEKNIGLLMVLIILVVSIAGLVQIVPLFFQSSTTKPVYEGKTVAVPYSPLRLVGRDIFIREGCVGCHSQMIRPLRAEVERYGHYSVAAESVFDHPFLWGSKRTGPDLARVGGRYSDAWHRTHLRNPRDVVPESNMPAYTWLKDSSVANDNVEDKMRALRKVGVPYTDNDIAHAKAELVGKTEEDALIAYLQLLGTSLKNVNPAAVNAEVEHSIVEHSTVGHTSTKPQ